MSTFCIALVLFAALAGEEFDSPKRANAAISQDSAAATDRMPSTAPVREGKELEAAAREALRRWAKVDKSNAAAAAREFIALFNELKRDASLSPFKRRELGGQVRGRLVRLAAMLPKNNGENRGSDSPPSIGDVPGRPTILGQLGGGGKLPGGRGNQGQAGQGGGPGGYNAPPDAGEDLVALIQKTIAPSSWDINGGPGSIQYWRSGHALVIRASEEVHEQIGGVLEQLQQAQ